MDFEIDFELFQRLTGFTSGDWGLYWIDVQGIRATTDLPSLNNGPRDVEAEIAIRRHIQEARLEWPTTAQALLNWQDRNMPLDLPNWFLKIARSSDAASSFDLLRKLRDKSEFDLQDKIARLRVVSPSIAQDHFIAKKERDDATRTKRAIQGCEEALRRAVELRLQEDWLERLRTGRLSSLQLDYFDFLQLTSFNGNDCNLHTSDSGFYSLVRNSEGEVIGISSGPGIRQLEDAGHSLLVAEHQRIAHLRFPVSAEELVKWIFRQGGDVDFVAQGFDSYPCNLDDWLHALTHRVGMLGTRPRNTSLDDSAGNKKGSSRVVKTRSAGGVRESAGSDDIRQVLKRIGATRQSNPRQLEPLVRSGLLQDALVGSGTMHFRNREGVLEAHRAGRWSPIDREALSKRIETALNRLSD
jgi:hypothetical protein